MRTKALIVAAALAAGLATSMAQNVYSLNVVGYINLELAAGWNLVANQLNTTNNTLEGVFGTQLADNTQVFKFSGGTWSESALFVGGMWVAGGDLTVNPGEGVFISSPDARTVTCVGEVKQGALSTDVPAGFSVVSSQVPQAGLLSTDLGYGAASTAQMFFWDKGAQSYASSAFYLGGGAYATPEPTIAVGEAFFVSADAAGTWDRNFTVE